MRKGHGNARGQAMVETLMITVLLTVIGFALLQLCIIVLYDLISNEAVFAINRVAVVTKESDVETKTNLSALYLLKGHISLATKQYMPYRVPVEKKEFHSLHDGAGAVAAYNTSLLYLSGTIFPWLLRFNETYSLGNYHFIKRSAVSRMVKSPDEEFYDKAYPDGSKF